MINDIYILGNSLIPNDAIPLRILPKLRRQFPKINFIHFDPTEELPENLKELILIDSVVNIIQVTVFNSLEEFENSPRNSVHDYDLSLDLKLLIKLGRMQKVKIIGIPGTYNQQKALKEVSEIINSILL
jgi:hypothetical protein